MQGPLVEINDYDNPNRPPTSRIKDMRSKKCYCVDPPCLLMQGKKEDNVELPILNQDPINILRLLQFQ